MAEREQEERREVVERLERWRSLKGYRAARRAYALLGAQGHFQVNYYPAYADPATRTKNEPMPLQGLTSPQYYRDYSYVIVPDHSFRKEPALKLLKKCFQEDDYE